MSKTAHLTQTSPVTASILSTHPSRYSDLAPALAQSHLNVADPPAQNGTQPSEFTFPCHPPSVAANTDSPHAVPAREPRVLDSPLASLPATPLEACSSPARLAGCSPVHPQRLGPARALVKSTDTDWLVSYRRPDSPAQSSTRSQSARTL